MAQMPKNRLNSVNRLGTTITTRRIGVGKALTTDTPPARSPRRPPGPPPPRAPPALGVPAVTIPRAVSPAVLAPRRGAAPGAQADRGLLVVQARFVGGGVQ